MVCAEKIRTKQTLAGLLLAMSFCGLGSAQLVGEPPLPAKHEKHKKQRHDQDLEWMWQYGPPPEGGREHEFIQDPSFRPFLERNFTAPQSFWGLQPDNVKDARRKSLPDTIEDFLDVPGTVGAEENRYITVTGAVFHFPASRGLLFADLDSPHPLLAFAAIDWIRDAHTTREPNAEYTLWIFTNQQPAAGASLETLSPPFRRSLTRWMATPLAGSGIVQKIRAAILVGGDGVPHQIPLPQGVDAQPQTGPQLPKRAPS